MAYATKPTAATLFQMSVALAFFLAVCMARNIANFDPATVNLVKPTKLTSSEILGMPPMPSSQEQDPESNAPGCTKTYNVKKGETCYSTWTRFKVKEETFYALNPSIDCDNLDIGQALCIGGDAEGDLPKLDIPTLPVLPALPPSTESGNPETNTSGCSKTYKVKKGETCYSTWTKFKVKETTFYALNPGIDCDNLDIGQALCIAGGAN